MVAKPQRVHSAISRGPLLPPTLVVGMNRSGTKWLSNTLCNHPQLVGAQSDVHCGIIESNMLNRWPTAMGDLQQVDNYVALVELWSKTDFFRAIEADRQLLYSADPRPTTAFDMFRLVMEDYCRRRGALGWVQKTSPWWAGRVLRHFPDSRVVIICREAVSNVRSLVQLSLNQGRRIDVTRATISYTLQHKLLRHIERHSSTFWVDYEELKSRPRDVLGGLCEWLGLEFDPELLRAAYRPNTSFVRGSDRTRAVGSIGAAWVRAVRQATRLVPTPVLRGMRSVLHPTQLECVRGTFTQLCGEVDIPASVQ